MFERPLLLSYMQVCSGKFAFGSREVIQIGVTPAKAEVHCDCDGFRLRGDAVSFKAGRQIVRWASMPSKGKHCASYQCRSGPPSDMHDQADDEEDQEEKEQYLRNSRRSKGNRAEAEQARYDRDDQENHSPIKHFVPPLVARPISFLTRAHPMPSMPGWNATGSFYEDTRKRVTISIIQHRERCAAGEFEGAIFNRLLHLCANEETSNDW